MEVEYEKRFRHGWVYQGSYTWSKALGENELGSTQYYDNNYRDPENRSFDKRIMTFNRTNVFKSNAIYELPFGHGRAMMKNANRLVDGVLGGWKLSGILDVTSGVPFTVTAPVRHLRPIHHRPDARRDRHRFPKAPDAFSSMAAAPVIFATSSRFPIPVSATIAPSMASQQHVIRAR